MTPCHADQPCDSAAELVPTIPVDQAPAVETPRHRRPFPWAELALCALSVGVCLYASRLLSRAADLAAELNP